MHLVSYLPQCLRVKFAYQSEFQSQSKQQAVFFGLTLMSPTKVIQMVFSTLARDGNFYGELLIWFVLNQVKRLSDVDCNMEITVSVPGAQVSVA